MSSLEIFHSEENSIRWDRHVRTMMETVKRTQNPYVLAFTLKFAARFYFKQKQYQTAIKLVDKALQIYPPNHRLRKQTLFDLYRYQMKEAQINNDDITTEKLQEKLKEIVDMEN